MHRARAAALAFLAAGGCAHDAGRSAAQTRASLAPSVKCDNPQCSAYHVLPAIRVRTPYGIGCWGNVPPGTQPNPIPPPLSYLAIDEGKADVPDLTPKESAMLHRIERYVHSPTLRFVRLNDDELVVFDAAAGPCADVHYAVLNDGCNTFYEPGETPYNTLAGTPGNWPCHHPWNDART
jgi:hypothetical protein